MTYNVKVTGGREGEVPATALPWLIGTMLNEGTLADARVHRNVRPLKSM
jgi:hypothetical protein